MAAISLLCPAGIYVCFILINIIVNKVYTLIKSIPTVGFQTNIQKRAVKWILCEQFYFYSEAYYMQKLIDLDILPMAQRFFQNDLILFFKILKGITPISLPSYVTIRSDTRNAKNCITYGIDNLIAHSPIKNVFGYSFFSKKYCIME